MFLWPGDPYKPEVWDVYRDIARKYEPEGLREEAIQKTEFYPKGAKCYACIATNEGALYANLILKKGVVKSFTLRQGPSHQAGPFDQNRTRRTIAWDIACLNPSAAAKAVC